MQRYSLFLLPFFLFSCQLNTNKDNERRRMLQQSRYDTAVIAHLDDYTVLKDFLMANKDTLIWFRNAIDSARPLTPEERKRHIVRQPSYCFRLSVSNYDWELRNIPVMLQSRFDSLYKVLSEAGLRAIQVDSTGEVEMFVRSEVAETNVRLSHSLHWDKRETRFAGKDTLLGDCRYAIHVLVYGE